MPVWEAPVLEMVYISKNISYSKCRPILSGRYLSSYLPYKACYQSQMSRNARDIWIMLKLLQFVCSFCTRVPPCSPCSFCCYSIAQGPDDLITLVITMKLYIESHLKMSQELSAGGRHTCDHYLLLMLWPVVVSSLFCCCGGRVRCIIYRPRSSNVAY